MLNFGGHFSKPREIDRQTLLLGPKQVELKPRKLIDDIEDVGDLV